MLDQASQSVTFDGLAAEPVLSINRGFSAPVNVERVISDDELVFLAAHDDDPFARYEAMQDLVVGHLKQAIAGALDDTALAVGRAAIGAAIRAVLEDTALDDQMRGELLLLPGEAYLAEQMELADPGAIHRERQALRGWLGKQLADQFTAIHERTSAVAYSLDPAARGARKMKTQALAYLAAGEHPDAAALAAAQYDNADNMTDRQGALMVLTGLSGPERTHKLLDFYNRFKTNPLVIDKWFALQASSLHPEVLKHVQALGEHPDFTFKNPNRVRSLFMAFAYNPHGFHAADGAGYRLIADVILELDPINPQTAARFVPPLGALATD